MAQLIIARDAIKWASLAHQNIIPTIIIKPAPLAKPKMAPTSPAMWILCSISWSLIPIILKAIIQRLNRLLAKHPTPLPLGVTRHLNKITHPVNLVGLPHFLEIAWRAGNTVTQQLSGLCGCHTLVIRDQSKQAIALVNAVLLAGLSSALHWWGYCGGPAWPGWQSFTFALAIH